MKNLKIILKDGKAYAYRSLWMYAFWMTMHGLENIAKVKVRRWLFWRTFYPEDFLPKAGD